MRAADPLTILNWKTREGEMMIFQHKTCSECKRQFPATLAYFHKDKRINSGLKAACKWCSNARLSKYRVNYPERIRESTLKYSVQRRDELSCKSAEWARRNPDKKAAQYKRYQKNHPDHCKAQSAVHYAVKIGKLSSPKTLQCAYQGEGCKGNASEYHHYLGYAQEHWLDVIPVCARCHRKLDKKRGQ